MGSVCCVAARDKTLPNRTGRDYLHRRSPSWSLRWESRGRIEDTVDNPARVSPDIRENVGLEEESEALSYGGSPLETFRTPSWRKSPICSAALDTLVRGNDLSAGSNFSTEDKAFPKPSDPKLSVPIPSTSKEDPSSSHSHSLPSDSTPSRRCACSSPAHQLSRQVSDCGILAIRTPNENSVSEGRKSSVLPVCSSELTHGSHSGASDNWSMRMFSELVASSQRERWSFDSEKLVGSGHGKITSPTTDLQTCGICSKLLTERSSWRCNELSVVAVLVCGHVYHAECLENSTPEVDRYDPSCPVCLDGEKPASKMSRGGADSKARNKISRIGVADIDLDGNAVPYHDKGSRREGKGPKMEASSSIRSSFGKPFLKRHFSMGSKPARSFSENESSRRKGFFWARYRKE